MFSWGVNEQNCPNIYVAKYLSGAGCKKKAWL